jgi:hypothetical protein
MEDERRQMKEQRNVEKKECERKACPENVLGGKMAAIGSHVGGLFV